MSFKALFDFEQALAEYTGAPYAVVTDGCTHALELCFRYDQVRSTKFSAHTYLSIPMLMHHLNISYELVDEPWKGEYLFHGTRIWDSARKLDHHMYRAGQLQCLSFGWGKPMQLGKVGAVLLDDKQAYKTLSRLRSDGRDLRIIPWEAETRFEVGYHYCPTLELCEKGLALLPTIPPQTQSSTYPDCRNITIQT